MDDTASYMPCLFIHPASLSFSQDKQQSAGQDFKSIYATTYEHGCIACGNGGLVPRVLCKEHANNLGSTPHPTKALLSRQVLRYQVGNRDLLETPKIANPHRGESTGMDLGMFRSATTTSCQACISRMGAVCPAELCWRVHAYSFYRDYSRRLPYPKGNIAPNDRLRVICKALRLRCFQNDRHFHPLFSHNVDDLRATVNRSSTRIRY